MNLAMKNSLVIYDQNFRFFNFAENFARYQAPKVIFLFIFKNPNNFLMGLKNTILLIYAWKSPK